ncbi:MAG: hypothetical protein WAV76_16040, partial [Bacteroidota bacterium]
GICCSFFRKAADTKDRVIFTRISCPASIAETSLSRKHRSVFGMVAAAPVVTLPAAGGRPRLQSIGQPGFFYPKAADFMVYFTSCLLAFRGKGFKLPSQNNTSIRDDDASMKLSLSEILPGRYSQESIVLAAF